MERKGLDQTADTRRVPGHIERSGITLAIRDITLTILRSFDVSTNFAKKKILHMFRACSLLSRTLGQRLSVRLLAEPQIRCDEIEELAFFLPRLSREAKLDGYL